MDHKARIFILEDDKSLVSVLSEALEEAGYFVESAHDPEEGLKMVRENKYEILLIDVLLSGMTGVDFALKVRNELKNTRVDIAFMSGVFKDKGFVKETLAGTKALFYLTKPFELDDLIKRLDERYCVMTGEEFEGKSSRQIINELLYKNKSCAAGIHRSIGALRDIHGFDFPMVLSFLVDTGATGELSLKQDSGLEGNIRIAQGRIIFVSTNRQDSLLGNLLLEMGYLKADDLNRTLGDSNIDQSERLGIKLLKANVLSPHAFSKALEYQMIMRLSHWVTPNNIQFKFSPIEVKLERLHITPEKLTDCLHDWVMSTINPEWLESIYRSFEASSVIKGSRFQLNHSLFKKPLFENNQELQKALLGISEFSELLKVDVNLKEDIWKGIHLLAMKRLISFGEDEAEYSEEDLIKKFQVIQQSLSGKNTFEQVEYLGIALDSDLDQMRMTFEEFVESLPISQDAQSGSSRIRGEIIGVLERALDIVSSPNKRKGYEEKIQKDDMRLKMRARDKMQQAKTYLQSNQGRQALEVLKDAEDLYPNMEQLKEHTIWAKLCTLTVQNKSWIIKDVEKSMTTVPPDRRFSSLYMYLEGIVAMHKGDLSLAQDKLEGVLQKSPSMVEAKRALNIVRLKSKQKKDNEDFFKRDLGEVVKSWFSKKSA